MIYRAQSKTMTGEWIDGALYRCLPNHFERFCAYMVEKLWTPEHADRYRLMRYTGSELAEFEFNGSRTKVIV